MVGVYIHIPFCRKKCLYCDFPSYGGVEKLLGPYVTALCREIEAFPGAEEGVDTIYFGGGTPSLLTIPQVDAILSAVRKRFSVTKDAELTLEANPDSFDAAYAKALSGLGVNRLSLGIQSFQDSLLRALGRLHTGQMGKKAVEAAHAGGITNVSADLMFGLPAQTLDLLKSDLSDLLSLGLTHASIYSLIVEEHTMLWDGLRRHQVVLPHEEQVNAMAELVWASMADGGFEHYEISSYCQPGFSSVHNSKYWKYDEYIGFGASAHSFYGNRRFSNLDNIYNYIKHAGNESILHEDVVISNDRAMEDFCFLALRMKEGLDYNAFQKRFGLSIEGVFGSVLTRLFKQELLSRTRTGCTLSKKGFVYGNYVFSQFIRE